MNLYLDDDTAGGLLVKLLQATPHDVLLPKEIGRAGAKDPIHFLEAMTRDRVVLTHNYDDFEILAELILRSGGHHPGVVAIRKDNDIKRDMRPKEIVRAIGNLESSGVTVANGFHILNAYR